MTDDSHDDRRDDRGIATDEDQFGRDGSDERSSTGAVERTLARLAPPGASVSALAISATDGTVVAAADPDRSVAPASNAKLMTAALALDHLGPDHRFETAIASRGRIEDGTLHGDLALRGSGAPDLTVDDLSTLSDAVADDLDRVTGDLVCDATRFVGQHLGPGRVWSDEHRAYGARSSALALAGNVVDVTVVAANETVTVSIDPQTDLAEDDVDVTASVSDQGSNGGPNLAVRPDHDSGRTRVEGTLPPEENQTVSIPVTRPVRHCGLAAHDALAAAGVDLAGGLRVVEDHPVDVGSPLAAVESASVRDLVRTMTVRSDNFVADQLARGVAATVRGEGSWEAWTETVDEHLDSLGAPAGRLYDGSGLSRYNRLQARAVVALLAWIREQPWSGTFFDSLPGPGEGTLKDRLDGVPVVAKTGTLTGARALSGRVAGGEEAVLFSALVGDVTVGADEVRDRLDGFVEALAEHGVPKTSR